MNIWKSWVNKQTTDQLQEEAKNNNEPIESEPNTEQLKDEHKDDEARPIRLAPI